MLQEFMEQEKITSQRELARRLEVPHSTIQDWLRPLKVTKEEYKEKVEEQGKTEVYRELRGYEEKKEPEPPLYDVEELIKHFRGYTPEKAELDKIRRLITVLMDCLKK